MKNNTAATAPATVRMFDGKGWDTYKVGSKKHKAAEARRAAWTAARPTAQDRLAAKSVNTQMASWMRENGLVPSGSAWAMAKAGERKVKTLKAANVADGLEAKKAAPKAKTGKAAKAEAPKTGKKAARKARSAAARKGWETRRANAGVTPEVVVANVAVEVDPFEEFSKPLFEAGLSSAQVAKAWTIASTR